MLVFPIAAFLRDDMVLMIVGIATTVLAFGIHLIRKEHRRKRIADYVRHRMEDISGVHNVRLPFPLLVFRMEDDGVILANDAFVRLTGFRDMLTERSVQDVLPGFRTEWLNEGKNEYPYDVTLSERRYRVYGTVIQTRDDQGTRLGVLYFTDLTELYQVRDEYIRSRPVVSIILVDN